MQLQSLEWLLLTAIFLTVRSRADTYQTALNTPARDANQFNEQLSLILGASKTIFPTIKNSLTRINALNVNRSEKVAIRHELQDVLDDMRLAESNRYITHQTRSTLKRFTEVWDVIQDVRNNWESLGYIVTYETHTLLARLKEIRLIEKIGAFWEFVQKYGSGQLVNTRNKCDRINIELTTKFLADTATKGLTLLNIYTTLGLKQPLSDSINADHKHYTSYLVRSSAHCYENVSMFAERDIIRILHPMFEKVSTMDTSIKLKQTVSMIHKHLTFQYNWLQWTTIGMSNDTYSSDHGFRYNEKDAPLHFSRFPSRRGMPRLSLVTVHTKPSHQSTVKQINHEKVQLCPKLISQHLLSVSILWFNALHYAHCIWEQLATNVDVKFVHVYRCNCHDVVCGNCQQTQDSYFVDGCTSVDDILGADYSCGITQIKQTVVLSAYVDVNFVLFIVVIRN